MSIDAGQVAERIGGIRELMAAHASRRARLVAVTKGFGVDAVIAALDAGATELGENYAQELLGKQLELEAAGRGGEPTWHFIGHLQRNKVRSLAPVVSMWQTVDSQRLGGEIARRAPGATVMVQVNLSGADGQGGVAADGASALVDGLRSLELDVAGLMMIGRAGDLVTTRALFARLRQMCDDLGLAECSMGMSGDLHVALEEGATIVRVGTAIFGPRPTAR